MTFKRLNASMLWISLQFIIVQPLKEEDKKDCKRTKHCDEISKLILANVMYTPPPTEKIYHLFASGLTVITFHVSVMCVMTQQKYL